MGNPAKKSRATIAPPAKGRARSEISQASTQHLNYSERSWESPRCGLTPVGLERRYAGVLITATRLRICMLWMRTSARSRITSIVIRCAARQANEAGDADLVRIHHLAGGASVKGARGPPLRECVSRSRLENHCLTQSNFLCAGRSARARVPGAYRSAITGGWLRDDART